MAAYHAAGAPLYEILAAGEWSSPAFLQYLDCWRLEVGSRTSNVPGCVPHGVYSQADTVIQAHVDENEDDES